VVMKGKDVLYRVYRRHMAQVRQAALEALQGAKEFLSDPFKVAISGSAGLGVAECADIDFVQEVFATYETVKEYQPDTDAVVELGGEDAKIIFLTGGLEERMNGSCAGGTGAFIDQMATLLNVTSDELDTLALNHEKIYPIASRCGVFAKTDVQPLMNQGARKEDIAASIFQAVVDQTIAGLAQGREIEGKVLFLGGPLFYYKGLQQRFVETLKLDEEHAIFPDYGRFAVAMGAALYADNLQKEFTFDELERRLKDTSKQAATTSYLEPLFRNQQEYQDFVARHKAATIPWCDIKSYHGDAYLGIDCGSTTTKLVLMNDDYEVLYQYYASNQGNPVQVVKQQLETIYGLCGDHVTIRSAVSTGYGEDLIKNAFDLDEGIVETMAHFTAARHFEPKVDFILDIGGQDIKCFRIKNEAIDSIMLNEACSSGCGSFIETFAKSMGYTAEQFSQLGLFSQHPVDLGSRCTVFMNSSVKQAQKDGASVEDISAGLSMSVVKNVLYKVIRTRSAKDLGENIVVQGGTFLNDAVLRSFELELGHNVIRPKFAGLMGAYGAAIYGKRVAGEKSSMLKAEQLKNFYHEAKPFVCQGCTNHCNLTINTFGDGKRFISGNRCEKPLGLEKQVLPDLYNYKLEKIKALKCTAGKRGKIGLPLGLNMFENIHFWHAFLTELGYEVVLSDLSSRKLYALGQHTIPSDTACYPAKLMHGHIENLVFKGVDTIFYPCMSYNFNEHKGDNHYNCPVVAYYPELLYSNMAVLKKLNFWYPYLYMDNRKLFEKKAYEFFRGKDASISKAEVKAACDKAYARYVAETADNKAVGLKAIEEARKQGKGIVVLAGRPYHIDPEINHGINSLITSLGLAVVSEDCVADLVEPVKVNVLNQWTYHSRLYNAAKYVTTQDDMELVQLVSFGCGIDAVTTDEVSSILTEGGKLYTQLKIDEINNLGAVKIRLRSLIGAIKERKMERGE
ncbi:MAG: 2-hydroxyacyl-CoA dehydratase, partial [Oscillospiraceae bacterium]|nr:2-hydroxyacyl-CoA dehydratase [Oscillospiraceae bacterium]